jgi:fatty-acid desaturase
MGLFHVGTLAALFFFTWKAVLVAIFLWLVSGSLGIDMGYHRRSLIAGTRLLKWVEYCLIFAARWLWRSAFSAGRQMVVAHGSRSSRPSPAS